MRRKYPIERSAALGVAQNASHLHLVHRVDEPGRCAGLSQDVADIDDLGEARAFAVECGGYHAAEQALLADFGEGFTRKPAFGIDGRSVVLGDLGCFPRARNQVIVAFAEHGNGAGRASYRFSSSVHDRPLFDPNRKIIVSPSGRTL